MARANPPVNLTRELWVRTLLVTTHISSNFSSRSLKSCSERSTLPTIPKTKNHTPHPLQQEATAAVMAKHLSMVNPRVVIHHNKDTVASQATVSPHSRATANHPSNKDTASLPSSSMEDTAPLHPVRADHTASLDIPLSRVDMVRRLLVVTN